MKKLLLTALLCLGILAAIGCFRYRQHIRIPDMTTQRYLERYGDTLTLQQRLNEARDYTKRHDLNTQYVILVDFNKPSGDRSRFRLYDLEARKTILSSPCMHGIGGGSTDTRPAFSNKPGSNCSSLGKFVTAGRKTTGKLGTYKTPSYTLRGRSGFANSNTERRGVVIHGWAENAGRRGKYLKTNEKLSQGCFAIESGRVRQLGRYIEQSDKPILLWAYHKPA